MKKLHLGGRPPIRRTKRLWQGAGLLVGAVIYVTLSLIIVDRTPTAAWTDRPVMAERDCGTIFPTCAR